MGVYILDRLWFFDFIGLGGVAHLLIGKLIEQLN